MSNRKNSMQVELTQGPVLKNLMRFALPILLSMTFQYLYNTMDAVIVGYTLGDEGLAKVGASTPVYELIVGFATGMGNGLPMVVSRCYGTGDMKRLKKAVAAALELGLLVSLILTIGFLPVMKPFFRLLSTPEEILSDTAAYMSIITCFLMVMFAYNVLSGLLRAVGNSVMPLVFLIISSVSNILLDLIFIRELGLGIRGAAWATVIAQGISVVLCFLYIVKIVPMLIPGMDDLRPDGALLSELLNQGFSMAILGAFTHTGTVILQSSINGMGTYVIAGHTSARKLYGITNMPMYALAQALATFVAQNRGAGLSKRIHKGVKAAARFCIIYGGIVGGLLLFAAPRLVELLTASANDTVIGCGTLYLRMSAAFYMVLGLLYVCRFSLLGLGKTFIPVVTSIVEFGGKIIFVVLLIPGLAYTGVALCEPVIWTVMLVILAYVYQRESKLLKGV